jgi:hypothetical protein
LLVQAHASIVLTQETNRILKIIFYKNSDPIATSEQGSPTTPDSNVVQLSTETLVELAPEDTLSVRVTSINSTEVITAQFGSLLVGTIGRQGTPGPKGDKGDKGDPGDSSGGTPGGANTQVQFNNNGSFGGTAGLVFNPTTISVGLNLSSPTSRLDIVGQDGLRITGFQPFLTLRDSNSTNKGSRLQTVAGNTIFSNDSNGGGTFTERLRISDVGFVGVGLDAPEFPLHVRRTGGGGPVARFEQTGNSNATLVISHNTAATSERPALSFLKGGTTCIVISCDGLVPGVVYYEAVGPDASHTFFTTNGLQRFRIDNNGIQSFGRITGGYSNRGTNVVNMAFEQFAVSQVAISTNVNLTTAVPPAGTVCVLIIVSNGANSRTVTFGAGFAATGTLATGTTSDRRFVITWVSDGVRLLETQRVGPIAF